MFKSLLLLVALVSVGRCSPAGHISPKDFHQSRSNWPCPAAGDIAPCVCTTDADLNLFMDCSDVYSTSTLETIFAQDFPFLDFKSLIISPSSPASALDTLPAGVFGTATFQHIIITGTYIDTIEEETLVNSHETLQTLDISNNELSSFPFETLPLFIYLWQISVAYNSLDLMDADFPDIVSDSLRILILDGNTGLTFTESTFSEVNILEELHIQGMSLGSLPPNVFSQLSRLHTLDLGINDLSGELIENFINPDSHSLRILHLHNNQISDIHPEAITGLDRAAQVNFRNNKITELRKEKWRPLLDSITEDNAIDLRDNELLCGCDVYWMVADSRIMAKIHQDTFCASGVRIHDLPLSFFQQHCPDGPALW